MLGALRRGRPSKEECKVPASGGGLKSTCDGVEVGGQDSVVELLIRMVDVSQ